MLNRLQGFDRKCPLRRSFGCGFPQAVITSVQLALNPFSCKRLILFLPQINRLYHSFALWNGWASPWVWWFWCFARARWFRLHTPAWVLPMGSWPLYRRFKFCTHLNGFLDTHLFFLTRLGSQVIPSSGLLALNGRLTLQNNRFEASFDWVEFFGHPSRFYVIHSILAHDLAANLGVLLQGF